jgi:hypothetical protein
MDYIVCPKCGYTQLNSKNCKKCNVLFDSKNTTNTKNKHQQFENENKLSKAALRGVVSGCLAGLLIAYSVVKGGNTEFLKSIAGLTIIIPCFWLKPFINQALGYFTAMLSFCFTLFLFLLITGNI